MAVQLKQNFQDDSRQKDVRTSNIIAGRSVADAVRTSLGPRGMDKMIEDGNGNVTISNDGATILDKMSVMHPVAKMLVELSHAQDVEAGDGTTSVVVLAGSLLSQCLTLLERGVHPTTVSESFQLGVNEALRILTGMAIPVTLDDRESLLQAANTAYSSKVVSQYSSILSPIAVDAVLKVIDPKTATNVDLRDVKVVTKIGGTVDDTELVEGLVFTTNKARGKAGGPQSVRNAKIGLIQFQLSPPKPDMENQVVVTEYSQMDRILKEERQYLLDMCKKIQKAGCNVLLIQKSILRDAVTDLSLHFLAKLKILVVTDVERDDIEFICKTTGCRPISHIDHFVAEKLGTAGLVESIGNDEDRYVKITEVPAKGTVSILVRGSNALVLAEAERSIHDALCVIRSLVKCRYLIVGGGAPEMEISRKLLEYAKTFTGLESLVLRHFAEAVEIIPTTLAENAGLQPIKIVTELRARHAAGEIHAGINVREGCITDIKEENVVQPLLVNTSALSLATETVRLILKIDDMVMVR